MSDYIKNNLSFSTDGTAIGLITTPKLIHLSTASSTDWDEVWIYVNNTHTYQVVATLEFGGAATPIVVTIPSRSGLTLVVPGLILNGGYVVTAYASVADRVFVTGYVNSIVGGTWQANGNAVYGYFAGGNTGASIATTDRIIFSTGVTSANSLSNLTIARYGALSVSDLLSYGYFAGGYSSAVIATADRIMFSTGITSVNTISNLSGVRSTGASVGDGINYGYFCGGTSGASYVVTADRIVFSTGTTSANSVSNLSQARISSGVVSDGVNYGYMAGGYTISNYVVTTDRISFSTGINAANTISNLTVAKYACGSVSNGSLTYGYFTGGETASAQSVLTDRIVFSTGTTSAYTVSNLSQARSLISSASDGILYGYFGGGDTAGGAAPVATTDRIIYSTEIILANTVSNMSSIRAIAGAFSDFCV